MLFSRRIGEYRPTILLAVLVLLSLASLATGKRASFIRHGVTTFVSVTSYPFLKALKTAESGYDYVTGMAFSYNDALKEAEDSRRRLVEAMLHAAQRKELLAENKRLRRMLTFELNQPGFTLEPARVRVLERFRGIAMIDCGAMQGIKETMCAVTDQGVVGYVTHVDVATANVITLRNAECKVGAMIARNRVRGDVHGSSSTLSRYCTMQYIDMKDDVRENDEVVTSTESVFPPGYPIGRIVAVHHDAGGVWQTADVEPAVDVFSLDDLFVLRQAITPMEELMGNAQAQLPLSVAPKIPDTRTIQDRFAP